MRDNRSLRLEGLEPDNLLAFMALLGLLRALEASERRSWRPQAAWGIERAPLRPILILAEPQTREAVCEAAAEGAAALAADYVFPQDADHDAAQKDLNYEKEAARRLLEIVGDAEHRRRVELWSALMCDVAEKEGTIEATPLCLLFGQGHQHFLDRLAAVPRLEAPPPRGRGKKAAALGAAEAFYETLFQPWTRQDPTPAFRWDPAEDVRYALRADDPSGEKSTTQHGANRLAALGLPAWTATPAQRGERVRLQVLGGTFERNEFALHWPIWTAPASLAAIRALLSHPALPNGASGLAHLSVAEVRRARRVSVGKFMNFTRADTISEERRTIP